MKRAYVFTIYSGLSFLYVFTIYSGLSFLYVGSGVALSFVNFYNHEYLEKCWSISFMVDSLRKNKILEGNLAQLYNPVFFIIMSNFSPPYLNPRLPGETSFPQPLPIELP